MARRFVAIRTGIGDSKLYYSLMKRLSVKVFGTMPFFGIRKWE